MQVQLQPADGISQQDKAAIPCNEAHRPVATCAHRGNAAELLAKAGVSASAADALQQMQLLWQAGVMCFDMDVIQLRGTYGTHPCLLLAAAAVRSDTLCAVALQARPGCGATLKLTYPG